MNIRVRFAPSPTGHLHIGSVRCAIFNWLYARHTNGKYLVRIEDTDKERSTKEFLDSQLKSLKWLGLQSDEPAVFQSQRIDQHKKIIKDLLQKGAAYPCFCKQKSAEQKVMELQSGHASKYDRTCRDKKWTQDDLNRPHAIRIKLPDELKQIEFEDVVRGKIKVDVDQLDDFVILRSNGTPTYNFCVVVDDIDMKISHVIRGEDHISNTPKQIVIYNALGANLPIFAHIPLILGSAGDKLSKRDADVSVEEYRRQGYLPDALFNYLVRLGWSHGDQEIFTKEELVSIFDIKDVGKKGAIFDIKKLQWLNGVYLRKMTLKQFLEATKDLENNYKEKLFNVWSQDHLEKLFSLYAQRAVTTLQLAQDIILLSKTPENLDLNLISKWRTEKTADLLNSFIQILNEQQKLNHTLLFENAKQICATFDEKVVALAQPLRLALTGRTVSPGVFELIEILGKDEVIKRIGLLINRL